MRHKFSYLCNIQNNLGYMKTRSVFLFCMALAVTIGTTSCQGLIDDIEEWIRNTNFDVPTLTETNSIVMTFTATDAKRREVGITLEGGKIAVDWGDGSPMTKDIHPERGSSDLEIGARTGFEHTYATEGEYEIKIWADELTFIYCGGDGGFNEISMDNCPALETAWLYWFSQNHTLDLDGCPSLSDLHLGYWVQLESVSLEACPLTGMAGIWSNPLLRTLDLGNKDGLKEVDCSNNALEELILPAGIEYVSCSGNRLTSIESKDRGALKHFYCNDNETLSTLDLSGCDNLEYLGFAGTAIEEFDFGGFPSLLSIMCSDTGLSSVDISGNEALLSLECGGLELTSLDVSGNPELQKLDCSNNALSTLDVTMNPEFRFLNIAGNLLGKEALEGIFTALPVDPYYGATRATAPPHHSMISIHDNPGAESCDTGIITDKGWKIRTDQ